MSKYIFWGIILFCFAAFESVAQILEIQYLAVPREHVDEFLDLHKEMAELSATGATTITGHWVFAHAYAGQYSLVMVNQYENAVTMEQDSANAGIRRYVASITDSTEKAAFNEKRQKYFSWYLEGHWDEVRGVQEGGYFKENIDPKQKHVVVVSHYNPAWADLEEFTGLYVDLLINDSKEADFADGVQMNTHYRGSGPAFSAVSWFPSWDAYAKSLTGQVDNETDRFNHLWKISGKHDDAILVSVGSLEDGKFILDEW